MTAKEVRNVITLISVCFLTLVCFFTSNLNSQELIYHLGRASFTTDYSALLFPKEVDRIYFDTSQCAHCRDSLPSWRFLHSLKVDSLLINGEVTPLTSESQMSGIVLDSCKLAACLKKYKVSVLLKGFSGTAPYDTLAWSHIYKKNVVIPDLARHYILRFDSTICVDSVLECLHSVPGLGGVAKRPKAYPDD